MSTVKLNTPDGGSIVIDIHSITGIFIQGSIAEIFLNTSPYKVTVLVDDPFLLLLTKYYQYISQLGNKSKPKT